MFHLLVLAVLSYVDSGLCVSRKRQTIAHNKVSNTAKLRTFEPYVTLATRIFYFLINLNISVAKDISFSTSGWGQA